MKKKFIKLPEGEKERILLALSLAEGISGRPASREELVEVFNDRGIELDDEIRLEIRRSFPHIVL